MFSHRSPYSLIRCVAYSSSGEKRPLAPTPCSPRPGWAAPFQGLEPHLSEAPRLPEYLEPGEALGAAPGLKQVREKIGLAALSPRGPTAGGLDGCFNTGAPSGPVLTLRPHGGPMGRADTDAKHTRWRTKKLVNMKLGKPDLTT